jgi:hypothetical protein
MGGVEASIASVTGVGGGPLISSSPYAEMERRKNIAQRDIMPNLFLSVFIFFVLLICRRAPLPSQTFLQGLFAISPDRNPTDPLDADQSISILDIVPPKEEKGRAN